MCVYFENRSVFSCFPAEPGCSSQWLHCVERVPLNAADLDRNMLTGWQTCIKYHSGRDTFTQKVLVLNNDMQLARMSMSLPVFVRNRLLLLWKLDVKLKNSLSVWLIVEKSPSIRESQASSPTLAAVARLSAMMHGQDRVYANAMLVDQVCLFDLWFSSICDASKK